jgi:hypothetical protein
MQWDDGPNAGFSTADPSRSYLPIDPDPTRPTVAAQEQDPNYRVTSEPRPRLVTRQQIRDTCPPIDVRHMV